MQMLRFKTFVKTISNEKEFDFSQTTFTHCHSVYPFRKMICLENKK